MKKLLHILPLMIALLLTACKAEIDDVQINAPVVTLGEVSEVTGNSAVIQANIKQQGGKVSYCLIRYGTSQTSLTETERYDVSSENVSLKLPSLQANTTYYYQVVVSSGYSEVESEVRSFTTLNPAVALSEASAVTATTALFQAQLHLEGSTPISCTLRYGTDVLSMTHSVAITDVQEDIEIPLSSLVIGTTYYCQLVVNLGVTKLMSELKSFTTLNPVVSLSEAQIITSTSAAFEMQISTDRSEGSSFALRYGTDEHALSNTLTVTDIKDNNQVVLTGLFSSTQYYVQLVVTFGNTERVSEIRSFTTADLNMEEPIAFADAEVKRVCVEYWDIDGDGELSYKEAASVTDLEDKFVDNKYINTFDELMYFSGLTSLAGFSGCTYLTSVTIPKQVTAIGDDAFYGCSSLADIRISDNITSIGNNAFWFCSSLKNVLLPETVVEIGEHAFYRCENLESFNLPSGITKISNGTFDRCLNLSGIAIPDRVTEIGSLAFNECNKITTVKIPDGVRIIQECAFGRMAGLTSLEIPESVTIFESGAFINLALTTIKLPKNLTIIGGQCFMFSKLVTVTLPETVTKIGDDAFHMCFDLTSIAILAKTPPEIGKKNVFYDDVSFPIYVPSESVEAYKAAWPTYASRIKAIP
ncbi:MAG: leucine-rich repeat protein [Bacteroidaceae bacterium]|nr:leucine-rich repeat protein [Bacteroidaceae bacterium]MBR1939814.1 leucine-rich repeat protein [Bacteroidaceae bacterium]